MPFQRRVLIVEDDTLFGSLMSGALTNEGFYSEVATSGIEGKHRLRDFDPDIVLVDIDLGDGPSGIDFVQMVSQTRPEIACILLSKHPDATSVGVDSLEIPLNVTYLRKGLVPNTSALIKAISQAARGPDYQIRHDKEKKGLLELLTKTQREILHMMALGHSNIGIARRRNVSLSNIEQRVSEICKVLDISPKDDLVPRVEAIRRYVEINGFPVRR